MSLEHPAPDEVVALRDDESAVAAELAKWCDGTLEAIPDVEGITPSPRIWLAAPKEPRAARLGDWIVRLPGGDDEAMSPQVFAARFEPVDRPVATS